MNKSTRSATQAGALTILLVTSLWACSSPEPGIAQGGGGSSSSTSDAATTMTGAGGDWTMRDECALEQDTCDPNAECIDTPNYYECKCKAGYTGDGEICIDENECALGIHDCGDNATCDNTPGSHSCTCDAGFAGEGTDCTATYLQLTVGYLHNCALREDNTAWCWGYGGNGRLGNDSSANATNVVQVLGDDWKTLVASGSSTCGIKNDGSLWCWGRGDYGQIGNDTTSNFDTPQQTGTDTDWEKVTLGGSHVCGLRAGGKLYCWGRNNYGQVGGATSTVKEPVAIEPATVFTDVAAGHVHTCGIKQDGTLWCWGRNNDAQLGIGTNSGTFNTPQQTSSDTDWASASLGNSHGCALKTSGALHCWGRNSEMQIGTGDTTRQKTPVEIDSGQLYSAIDLGQHTTCGLRKSDGSLWCWGNAENGQLGPGVEARTGTPVKVFDHTDWTTVEVGNEHICGSRTNNRIQCWGFAGYGQTGSGESAYLYSPENVSDGPTTISKVAAAYYSACAIGKDGSLWCWGRNVYSQLGLGDSVPRPTPTQLSGNDWTDVAVGVDHACGLQTSNAQTTLWCWGRNAQGQLGSDLPSSTIETIPAASGTDTDWASLSGFDYHMCGLKTGGELYCWGYNNKNQVSETSAGRLMTPTQIKPGTLYKNVSAGKSYTCAIETNGTLWCWGQNTQGQLGLGHKQSGNKVPTQVGTDNDWERVVAGYEHTCVMKTDDSLHCWGHGGYGQLGVGDKDNQLTPVQVPGSWTSVDHARYATCGLQADKTLWCWGNGGGGRLGIGNTSSPTSPTQIGSSQSWAGLAAGQDYSCAFAEMGRVNCWGSGVYGRTGVGYVWSWEDTPILEP